MESDDYAISMGESYTLAELIEIALQKYDLWIAAVWWEYRS
jgi:hypothetical protein